MSADPVGIARDRVRSSRERYTAAFRALVEDRQALALLLTGRTIGERLTYEIAPFSGRTRTGTLTAVTLDQDDDATDASACTLHLRGDSPEPYLGQTVVLTYRIPATTPVTVLDPSPSPVLIRG